MDTFWLKKFREEADRYYHLRINTEGKYDVFFHNYKVAKIATVNTREDGFKALKYFKRKYIIDQVNMIRKSRGKALFMFHRILS